jgi:cytochrome c oxidase subunit II
MNMIVSMIVIALIGIVTNNSVGESSRAADKTIHITAKKFEFTPGEITAKKGEPVALEIKSEDVNHGFSLPDFGVRGDVKPGSVLRLSFTPDKTGQFTFTCDVFCGSGHEEMSGTLTVTE